MNTRQLTKHDEKYLTDAEKLELRAQDDSDAAWLESFKSVNLRVDLTLRQRYATGLQTPRPRPQRVKYCTHQPLVPRRIGGCRLQRFLGRRGWLLPEGGRLHAHHDDAQTENPPVGAFP